MTKPCILLDRLYVPVEYVSDAALGEFTYELKAELSDEENPFEVIKGYIKTYIKVRNTDGTEYYGFARGNIPKIGRLFGDIPWTDKTAAPPMKTKLIFKGTLRTWEKNKISQQEAADEWLTKRYGILRASPRFGKTITSIYLITKLGLKTLIVTHQKDLLEQYHQSLLAFTDVDEKREEYREANKFIHFPNGQVKNRNQRNRDARGQICGYFQDYDNPEELDICLLCWQTFASVYGDERILKYKNTWGFNIIDEVHRGNSNVYAKVINNLAPRYRLGLTGTVERSDHREFIVRDIIGPVVAEGRTETIPCTVTIIPTDVDIKYKFPEPLPWLHKRIYKAKGRMETVLQWLMKDVEAGYFICFAFHSGSTPQLLQWREHLRLHDIKAEAFWGKCPNRDAVLGMARRGEISVLICNRSMLTGIDIPRWNCFYNAFPTSNVVFDEENRLSGNYYQEFSRIRTPFTYEDGKVKSEAIIRDFIDRNGYCYGSLKKRKSAYDNQKFKIVNIKPKTEPKKDNFWD